MATPVLKELKSLRDREGGSLGSLASLLLAEALTAKRTGTETPPEFHLAGVGVRVQILTKRHGRVGVLIVHPRWYNGLFWDFTESV